MIFRLNSLDLSVSQRRKLDAYVDTDRVGKNIEALRRYCEQRGNVPLRSFAQIQKLVDAEIEQREVRKRIEAERRRQEEQRRRQEDRYRRMVCLFVVAAKMAKADGHVDGSEVNVVLRLFEKFGITFEERGRYVVAFNEAVRANADVDSYVRTIADDFPKETRLFFYELLWDVACADGVIDDTELSLLRTWQVGMALDADVFDQNLRLRSRYRNHRQGYGRTDARGNEYHSWENRSEQGRTFRSSSSSRLEEAYELLGGHSKMTNEELKSAYHAKAKAYHPDLLRAKGVPEDLIEIANAKMVKLNESWELIQKTRGV